MAKFDFKQRTLRVVQPGERPPLTPGSVVLAGQRGLTAADWPHLMEGFCRAGRRQALSDRTIKTRVERIRLFIEFIDRAAPGVGPDELTRDHINAWIDDLQERKRAPSTINGYLNYLRTFLKWLASEKRCRWPGNDYQLPTEGIKSLRELQDEITPLLPVEVEALLGQPDRRRGAQYRDWVLLSTMIDTGLRLNEAVHIERERVDLSNATISIPAIHAKMGIGRTVHISDELIERLGEWMRRALPPDCPWIFPNTLIVPGTTDYTPIRARTFEKALKRYVEKAKITKRVYPHLVRHTYAERYLSDGGDLATLAAQMGHRDFRTTKKYLHFAKTNEHAEQVRKHSPLAGLRNRPKTVKVRLGDGKR